MISGDRLLITGRGGPLHDMLSDYRRHWDHIDVLCPRPAAVHQLQPFDNVRLHGADTGRWGHPEFILKTVERLAENRQLHLLVSHDYGWFRNGVGALRVHRRLGLPWISEIHHVDGYPHRSLRTRDGVELALRNRLAKHFVQRFSSQASGFRVVCDQVADLLLRWGVSSDRILRLSSLYLDFDHLYPPTEDNRPIDLLFCGRLDREKGIDLLIATLDRLWPRRPDLRVVIVGRGRGKKVLRRAMQGWAGRSIEHIERHLTAAELANLYRQSKVLLCTSWSEGNPRVVAEAMACGVIVVSTPVGRVPELVRDGVHGRLVPWDAERMSTAVAELLANPGVAEAMSAAAPEVVAEFDKQEVLAQLAATYRSIAQPVVESVVPGARTT